MSGIRLLASFALIYLLFSIVNGCKLQSSLQGVLQSGVYLETQLDSSHLCRRMCWYSTSCRSCSWGTRTSLCQLSKDTKDTSPGSFSVSQHHIYTEVRSPSCLIPTHPCYSRPCKDGEICCPVEGVTNHICLLDSDLKQVDPSLFVSTPGPTSTAGRRSSATSTLDSMETSQVIMSTQTTPTDKPVTETSASQSTSTITSVKETSSAIDSLASNVMAKTATTYATYDATPMPTQTTVTPSSVQPSLTDTDSQSVTTNMITELDSTFGDESDTLSEISASTLPDHITVPADTSTSHSVLTTTTLIATTTTASTTATTTTVTDDASTIGRKASPDITTPTPISTPPRLTSTTSVTSDSTFEVTTTDTRNNVVYSDGSSASSAAADTTIDVTSTTSDNEVVTVSISTLSGITTSFATTTTASCFVYYPWKYFKYVTPMSSSGASDGTECEALCTEDFWCFAFSFNFLNRQCQLFDGTADVSKLDGNLMMASGIWVC